MKAITNAANLAQAELLDITWYTTGQYEKRATVQPGKFFELCGGVTKGQSIGWIFDEDRALDFNVHFHEGRRFSIEARRCKRNLWHAECFGEAGLLLDVEQQVGNAYDVDSASDALANIESLLRVGFDPLVKLCDFFGLAGNDAFGHLFKFGRLTLCQFDLGHIERRLVMHLHHHGEVFVDVPRRLHLFHVVHATHHGLCHRFGWFGGDWRLRADETARRGQRAY